MTTNGNNDNSNREKVLRSLQATFQWYTRMVVPQTGKLAYEYDPVRREYSVESCPIRELSNVGDVAKLSRFFGRHEFDELIRASIGRFGSMLRRTQFSSNVDTNCGNDLARTTSILHFDSELLGELANVIHNAIFFNVLLEIEFDESLRQLPSDERDGLLRELADSILNQQLEDDGSFLLSFDDLLRAKTKASLELDGVRARVLQEFALGELVIALSKAFRCFGDPRYLQSVAKGLPFFEEQYHRVLVSPTAAAPLSGVNLSERLVFFASYQVQAVRLFIENLNLPVVKQDVRSRGLKHRAREWAFELLDHIVNSGYFDSLQSHPQRYATIEVAAGVSGLVDGLFLVLDELNELELEPVPGVPGAEDLVEEARRRRSDRELAEGRKAVYVESISRGVSFLLGIQELVRREGVPTTNGMSGPESFFAYGGYGHGFRKHLRAQRLDVTGSVVNALLKLWPLLQTQTPSAPLQPQPQTELRAQVATSLNFPEFQEIYPPDYGTWIPRR